MTKTTIKAEPILSHDTLIAFRKEIANEFRLRKPKNDKKNWWTKTPQDKTLVELGQWFAKMLESGSNSVGLHKKDVEKFLNEIERIEDEKDNLYPIWIANGTMSIDEATNSIKQILGIKNFLNDYIDFHFNNQTSLEL